MLTNHGIKFFDLHFLRLGALVFGSGIEVTSTGDRNEAMRRDGEVVPEIASAPAGGIRCGLDDMLAWANNWLVPNEAQRQWLGDAQRAEMVKALGYITKK